MKSLFVMLAARNGAAPPPGRTSRTRVFFGLRLMLATCAAAAVLSGQVGRGPIPSRTAPPEQPNPQQQNAQQQKPQQPQPAQQTPQPANAPGTPTAAAPAPATQAQSGVAMARLSDNAPFLLNNVSLTEMIDILARRLKINYILDPGVKGSVSIYTYGEVKPVDLMPLLETILRVNSASMAKVGDLYRIVPINRISQLPLEPVINADPKTLPDDERMILNLVFLKYATVAELTKLLQPFMGEGAAVTAYDPANLLLIQDNSRNMKRTMELIAMFDSDTFAGQRVRLFDIENSRPSDLKNELETVFKAYAFSEKNASVRFIPVDRINTIIAVAPNPGIFTEVESWIKKLDIAVKTVAGAVNNYVYRLKYGRAETVAMAIMALYTGNTAGLANLGSMAGNQNLTAGGGGYGGMGVGGMGVGGGGLSGMGGMGYPGAYSERAGGYAPMATAIPGMLSTQGSAPSGGAAPGTDLTGSYLAYGAYGGQMGPRIPRVIPNPFDNTLLIQGTPQEYEQISNLLRQLDVPPRQVLIDAKIYEVALTGAFSAGVNAYLEKKNTGPFSRALSAASSAGGVTLTTGMLALRSHELLGALTVAESTTHTRVISAPSIIATDSIAASMNVGEDVPVLTSQAVAGVQQSGSSLFSNTVSNRSSGVTLNILARVNSSGIVTMMINQNVSSPQAPPAGGIQSPSFQNRSFNTQITVQDGDTVAIGGIIQETNLQSSGGVPFLHRIPLLGAVFGAKSITKTRSELVVFLTPRVIYDTNQIVEAADLEIGRAHV